MSAISHDPLVSVIIPVYDGAEYVGIALESALSQTYRNLEILVIDDGSTDGTPAILDLYAARDARIRVLSQANSGVARARNRGIAEAHGDFIAPLDADDLWEPTKIDCQVRRILESGERTGFVYSWWVWIDRDGALLDRSPRWMMEGSAFELLLQMNFTGNASVPLFRRCCIEEAGGYNENLAAADAGGCEDWELALRVAERYDVAVVPEILLGYRRHRGSMSTTCDRMWRSQQLVVREDARASTRFEFTSAVSCGPPVCDVSCRIVLLVRQSPCRIPLGVSFGVPASILCRALRAEDVAQSRPAQTRSPNHASRRNVGHEMHPRASSALR